MAPWGVLSLESRNCNITANGPITSTAVRLGDVSPEGVIDTTVTAEEITISSVNSSILLSNAVVGRKLVELFTSSSSNGNIVVNSVISGSTGAIVVSAAKDFLQEGGVNAIQVPGPIDISAAGAITIEGIFRALNSGGFSTESIKLVAQGDIFILDNAQVLAHDEVIIASTNTTPSKTNPDNATNRPGTVDASQVHITGGGQLYWGDKVNLFIYGDNTPQFTASGKHLTFDATTGDISVESGVVFVAGN